MAPELLQIVDMVVDLLKGIAWPISAAIIAFGFRSELRSLLPRLRRAGPSGLEFDIVQQKQTEVKAISASSELKDFPGLVRTAAIAQVERLLHEDIEKAQISSDEREDLLIRLLAQARLETFFEQTYMAIFGSQIAALRRLNERPNATMDDALVFFEEVKNIYPALYENYGFASWLNFLKNSGFVRQNGNIFEITDIGRDFLLYLTARRLSENKFG